MLKRKYRHPVTIRHKVVVRRAKAAAVALAALGLAIFAAAQAPRAFAYARSRVGAPQWAKWKLARMDFSSVPRDHAQGVERELALRHGAELTARDAARLEKSLADKFPALRNVRVSRNWISKELAVSAERRVPVARLCFTGGATAFVDENGEVYAAEPAGGDASVLDINVADGAAGDKFEPETVAAFRALRDSLRSFPCKPETVSLEGRNLLSLRLEDGSLVDWGGLEHTAEKAARLAQVYSRMRERARGPYRVNMRYFDDGRILLSGMGAAAAQPR